MYDKVTILLVEDEINLLAGLADLFTLQEGRFKYEVLTAINGKKALKVLEDRIPEIIVSDIMMPEMDGYELLRTVRKRKELKDVSFVFLTAKGNRSDSFEDIQLNVDGYITKPYDVDELFQTIDDIVLLHLIKKNPARFAQDKVQVKENLIFLMEQIEKMRLLRLTDIEFFKNERKASIHPKERNGSKTLLVDYNFITAGIVHELRNGLGVIRNTVGFLKDDLEVESHLADLQKISISLDYLDLVIRNLQSVGDEFASIPRWVNLEKAIHETYLVLKSKLVEVTFEFCPDQNIKEIWFDEGQIKQVFMNLIKNASEAMPEGGKLTIRTHADIDNKIRIEIIDTGIGMSKANRERLFKEPFTTKQRGSGLGLGIVQSIIEANRGTIHATSRRNKGTSFTITLPISPG